MKGIRQCMCVSEFVCVCVFVCVGLNGRTFVALCLCVSRRTRTAAPTTITNHTQKKHIFVVKAFQRFNDPDLKATLHRNSYFVRSGTLHRDCVRDNSFKHKSHRNSCTRYMLAANKTHHHNNLMS